MKYIITNIDETHAMCYANSDYNDNIHQYKWGEISKCYLWILNYRDAVALVRRMYDFAIKNSLDGSSYEWAAHVIVHPKNNCLQHTYGISRDYNSPIISIGRAG